MKAVIIGLAITITIVCAVTFTVATTPLALPVLVACALADLWAVGILLWAITRDTIGA